MFCIFEIMVTKEYILAKLKSNKSRIDKFGIQTIGLFGSYARDEQTATSDIDILIEFIPDKENFDNYMAVYDLIEEMFGNEKLEVVTKEGLSPHIGPSILNEVIYINF